MTTLGSLEDWTLDAVRAVAASGIAENDVYDLKSTLQGKADHQRKVVAAFANTRGGFLVFGVTDDRQVLGVEGSELPRDFGNKLTTGLSPSVEFRFGSPLNVAASRSVWVCHIQPSKRVPHGVLLSDHWVFPRRTESGSNVSMNVEEVRQAFEGRNRRRSAFAWLQFEIQRIKDRAEVLTARARGSRGVELTLERVDATAIRPTVAIILPDPSTSPGLVAELQSFVDACMTLDRALEAASRVVIGPLHPSRTMRGSAEPGGIILRHAPAITRGADRCLALIGEVAP